jgi:hypothetical protein
VETYADDIDAYTQALGDEFTNVITHLDGMRYAPNAAAFVDAKHHFLSSFNKFQEILRIMGQKAVSIVPPAL